ncbi:hypothetical protein PQR63_21680 [Herbaspirillum rhizosphaerae]|uniref:AIG2 family protein n=1 Tax=Herbaspirillum rhizosphaerae TaxID=346179 RepID=A0ABW8ZES1_9BURK
MDNSSNRLVPIFFYGLHMDAESLQQKGIAIRQPRLATILHHSVVVREKAMLLREKDALAYGMLYHLTHAEIDILYQHQTGYRAEAFPVNDGEHEICAISMVHIEPPLDSPIDYDYVSRLRAVLERLGFPVDHLPAQLA